MTANIVPCVAVVAILIVHSFYLIGNQSSTQWEC